MSNVLTPINDISSQTFDELFSRYQKLDTDCLLIYIFDKVESSALVHLANQMHITGTEGWNNCETEAEQRALLKNSIKLHKYSGTKYALLMILQVLGIDGEVYEWFDYGGEPYYFKLSIDTDKAYDEEFESKLFALINNNKNVRSKLEKLLVHLVRYFEINMASAVITCEELIV